MQIMHRNMSICRHILYSNRSNWSNICKWKSNLHNPNESNPSATSFDQICPRFDLSQIFDESKRFLRTLPRSKNFTTIMTNANSSSSSSSLSNAEISTTCVSGGGVMLFLSYVVLRKFISLCSPCPR